MAITLSEAENNCKQGIRNLSGRVDLALGILCVSDILIQFSAILILFLKAEKELNTCFTCISDFIAPEVNLGMPSCHIL